jgi:hypothetical protein
LDEEEREELRRMEGIFRRFLAVDFEQDGVMESRDWMTFLRKNILEEGGDVSVNALSSSNDS